MQAATGRIRRGGCRAAKMGGSPSCHGASVVMNSDAISDPRFERSCPVTPWPASQRVHRAHQWQSAVSGQEQPQL